METFSASLALGEETVDFQWISLKKVNRSCYTFLYVNMNKLLNKQIELSVIWDSVTLM